MTQTPNQILHDQIQQHLSEREQELIDIHQAIVRVPTINRGDGTSAEETKCAAVGAEYLKKAGIASEIAEGAPGRGNLLAEIGEGSGRSILWMSHNDVVPVGELAAWTHPPFSAAIDAGRIWGRGSNDCKMLVAAQLFALAGLRRLGLPRRGRLRLAVGADEEVGGALGFNWLLHNRTDFLRADLAICEGGGSFIGNLTADGRPVISVGSGEKGRCDVVIRARAEGGHASTPWGKRNPLLVLAEAVRRIDAWRPETAPASPLFEAMAPWIGLPAVNAANLEDAIARFADRVPSMLASLRGQSRMTLTPTVLHCGDKANAIPTEATLTCDARLLPGQVVADLEAVVRSLLEGLEGVDFAVSETSEPSVSPFNEGLRAMFERAATRAFGEAVEIAPVWCVGATDAHFVRAAGTPVYGFQVVDPKADPARLGIHCIDESIEVRMLLPCALALAHQAVEFLEGSGA